MIYRFRRGWTLQELIAPHHVEFFDCHWGEVGTKCSLRSRIATATGVADTVLGGAPLSTCTVAQRMSWAAGRQTTRAEDIAYCLLGLFNVHMPLLYGEGGQRAFERLQEEIIKRTEEVSYLLWLPHSVPGQNQASIGSLAPSPDYFCRRESCVDCGKPFNYARMRTLRPQEYRHIFFKISNQPDYDLIRRDFAVVPLMGGRKLELYCYLLTMPTGTKAKSAEVILLNVIEDSTHPYVFAVHLSKSDVASTNAQYRIEGFQSIRLEALPMVTGRVATISVFRGLRPCTPSICIPLVRLRLMGRSLWQAWDVQKRAADDPETLYGAVLIRIRDTFGTLTSTYLTVVYRVAPPTRTRGFHCAMAADWSTLHEISHAHMLYHQLRSSDAPFLSLDLAQQFMVTIKETDRLKIRNRFGSFVVRMRPEPQTSCDKESGSVQSKHRAPSSLVGNYLLEFRKQLDIPSSLVIDGRGIPSQSATKPHSEHGRKRSVFGVYAAGRRDAQKTYTKTP